MKKRSQKLALILSSIMLAAMALSSCGGGGESSAASTGSGESSGATEAEIPESATIGVMIPHFGVLPNETPVGQAWEEQMDAALGCDITFEWQFIPYAEYTEKANIALAAADFPDLFRVMDKNLIVPYQDQGLFVELSGYTDSMPNYMDFVETVRYGESKVFDADGHFYGFQNVEIPRLEQGLGIYSVASYRYDTFEENGIKIPETTDEFYEAAKQLKQLYPDTYPVTRTWADTSVYTYHTNDAIFWNGEAYEYGPVTENYRAMLTWLNKLYSEGLLDPESFTEDSDMHNQKMLTGKVFMSLGEWFNDDVNRNNNEESDAYWVNALAPTDPEQGTAWQQVTNVNEPTIGGEIMVINSNSEYVDLIVKLCDLQYTDDVVELVTWGIEDESFVRDENGDPTFIDEIKNADDPWSAGDKYGMRASAGSRPGLQLAIDTKAFVDFAPNDACYIDGEVVETPWETAWPDLSWPDSELIDPNVFAPPITFTSEESQNNSTIMTAVQTMVDEYKLDFITGDRPLSEWDSYVSAVEGMGYQQVVDLYNEKAAAIVEAEAE